MFGHELVFWSLAIFETGYEFQGTDLILRRTLEQSKEATSSVGSVRTDRTTIQDLCNRNNVLCTLWHGRHGMAHSMGINAFITIIDWLSGGK